MASVTGLTIDDFENLPDALALNHELVDGELVKVSGNSLIHNRLRDYLNRWLSALVEKGKLGEVISEQEFDFQGNAYAPDVCFVSAANTHFLIQNCAYNAVFPTWPSRLSPRTISSKPSRKRPCATADPALKKSWCFPLKIE